MALRFTTTREEAATHGVKMLVYGPAGVGKTTLVRTAPTPLLISAESGVLSLGDADIPTVVVESFADLQDAFRFVVDSAEAQHFQTICLDSISELAEQCLFYEKTVNRDPRKAYGEMSDQVIASLRSFRDLRGRHVYFSAKLARTRDDSTGAMLYGPMMPGQQTGPQLPYLFDEVFALRVGKTAEGEDYRYLQTRLDTQYEAKDRSGTLDAIEPPDLTHIINKIQQGKKHG